MIKLIQKTSLKGCNIACLQMICDYFNKDLSASYIRAHLPKHSYGSTLTELSEFLAKQDIDNSLHADFFESVLTTKPAIVAIDLSKFENYQKRTPHYVVIQKVKDEVIIYDSRLNIPIKSNFKNILDILLDMSKLKQKELLLVCQ